MKTMARLLAMRQGIGAAIIFSLRTFLLVQKSTQKGHPRSRSVFGLSALAILRPGKETHHVYLAEILFNDVKNVFSEASREKLSLRTSPDSYRGEEEPPINLAVGQLKPPASPSEALDKVGPTFSIMQIEDLSQIWKRNDR